MKWKQLDAWAMRHPVRWGLSFGVGFFALLLVLNIFVANIWGAPFRVGDA